MSQLVFVGGTVTFDSAKREDGAVVSGSVDLVITRFVGGDHLSIRR